METGIARTTEMRTADRCAVLRPLLDAVLVAARPAWWTMAGWEGRRTRSRRKGAAFQQSWLLMPVAEDSARCEYLASGMSGPGQKR